MSPNAQLAAVSEMIALPDDRSLTGPVKEPTERFPWLKCSIRLDLPVVRFTIRDLLELRIGTVVETASKATSDVPVRVNGTLIGWTEFEVIGNTLAVRITELA
jgi:flagellar motor switch/type III secretory pathway protein FliN